MKNKVMIDKKVLGSSQSSHIKSKCFFNIENNYLELEN